MEKMPESTPISGDLTIAVLGGTGHVGVPYITEFLAEGVQVRVLARTPERVARRFPQVEVTPGSMMNEADVAHALGGADAAFLITPIGGNNEPGIELRAARVAVELLRRGQVVNGSLDVVEPTACTLAGVANLAGQVQGRRVIASGSWPFLPILRLAQPLFRRFDPVMKSKVTMLDYFSRHDYVGNPNQLAEVLPGFEATPMEAYLRDLTGTGRQGHRKRLPGCPASDPA